MRTVLLLIASNVFMTAAWYGHLKHVRAPLWAAVVISWGLAFFEYCFQVPANRLGFTSGFTVSQLKTLQEVITLVVFVVFARVYLYEPIRWNVLVGLAFIGVGAGFVFKPW